MQQQGLCGVAQATLLLLLSYGNAAAEIDLRNASVERLDNGLTVILLRDRNFPVVSVQMLYRVGARDESYGQTGIAHFLEHMAFRDSANFADTDLVSSIYARGGEWHGYTWTDQTTYFATVPEEQLDLLLSIEADRMTRLRISNDDMEAERGAVLAEMHSYENYPASMLIDAVMFTSFLAHPYRNNTIGWESDIENLKHDDVVAFYERHYQPANAVLAVVGDFETEAARARIEELFGGFEGSAPTPMPHTVEPVQKGERRVRLHGPTDSRRFAIGYRAPSANSPDFAAFLVLQEMLGRSSGVNFRQNDWGAAVGSGSILDGAAEDLTTWYPPSAQDYIFLIAGSAENDADEAQVEKEIERRLASVREQAPDRVLVAAAIRDVLDELVYDVETTEDAAHQLAFFDGLHALDTLFELPRRVAAATAADVQRVAQAYLLPERRTVGWYVPDDNRAPPVIVEPLIEAAAPGVVREPESAQSVPLDTDPVAPPLVRKLPGGIPAIVQRSDVSPSAYLQIVLPGNSVMAAGALTNKPVLGYSSIAYRMRPGDLRETVATAREEVRNASVAPKKNESDSGDPETRLERVFSEVMSAAGEASDASISPALIVVSGDVNTERAFAALAENFGDLEVAAKHPAQAVNFRRSDIEVNLGKPVAQAQLGYIVPVPGPTDVQSYACRMLLYILSHGYEGRLGKEAISNRGLAYYIDSRYRSDGTNGWITLAVGVDPEKVTDLKDLMKAELMRLHDEPPTVEEVEEAKQHLLGRARSSAQSNEELAAALAEEWLWYGDTLTPEVLRQKLGRTSRRDVLEIVPAFIDGMTIIVDK